MRKLFVIGVLVSAFFSIVVRVHSEDSTGDKVGNGTWRQVSKLVAADGRKNDEMGYSIAMSGNTIVVGAPYATINSHYAQGAAYVFVRSARGWVRKARLTASDGAINDFLGTSVSINGDTVAVGADGVNIKKDLHAGGAYMFVKPRTGWADMTQTAKLTASDEAAKAYLGSSIAISGDTVAIGADGAAVGANQFEGAVYVFVKPAKGWITTNRFKAKLTSSDGGRGDQLGYSLAMSGDTIAAGARSAAVGTNSRQGAVYIFSKSAQGWASGNEMAKLTASDGAKDDLFGYSVSIKNDTVVTGAPGAGGAGAVYLFVKPPNGWSKASAFTAKLTGPNGAKGDQLGYSVTCNASMVVAGARNATVGQNPRQGAVYVFSKQNDGWATATQDAKLVATDGGPRDGLGSALAMINDTLVAGAVDASLGAKAFTGAAYVFSTSSENADGVHMPKTARGSLRKKSVSN